MLSHPVARRLFAIQLDLNLRKKSVKSYILSIALRGAKTWTLWEVYQKYLEIFEMWCWRWMEKMRNEALHGVKEERNVLLINKIR